MKKVIIGFVAFALLKSSLFAGWYNGTISEVNVGGNGVTTVRLLKDNGALMNSYALAGTLDGLKAMLATVLTAKAQNTKISMYYTDKTWTMIRILPAP